MANRETLEVDVLVVGAGVGGLACAIHLHDQVKQYNRLHPGMQRTPPNILVLEKGPSVGAHILSGAVLDPRALTELIPDWESRAAPVRQKVTEDEVAYLTPGRKQTIPEIAVPHYARNLGNYIVSLSEVTQWLAEEARQRQIEILEGVGGAQIVYEGNRVAGVRCADTGLDKNRKPGPGYTPGAEIRARVTVLAEGVRGSLTKGLCLRLGLNSNHNPQTYATGVKELWRVPPGTFPAGKVLHALGYPLRNPPYQFNRLDTFGGSFLYGLDETHLVVGIVVGLDYEDPFLDPHNEFNRLKLHPAIRPLLENGEMLSYGAKAIPEGGYHALPRYYGDGFLIVGDAAGFLNAARLKGAHLAMKTGMLAAEALTMALEKNDCSARELGRFEDLFQSSWAKTELYEARNWRAAFARGPLYGRVTDLLQQLGGGKGLQDPLLVEADHKAMDFRKLHYGPDEKPQRVVPDGKITFDKLTAVNKSGTVHGEAQPSHLIVPDLNLCIFKCTQEYGNPCQHFCPAAVYEWIPPKATTEFGAQFGQKSKGQLQINFGNCVHCKTCDIKDPYQNIEWTVPEGGDGPRYQRL